MKKRVSPGFYNSEMESKYFWLYISCRKLNKQQKNEQIKESEKFKQDLIRFELKYYKVSKMNRILNEISKNKDEIIKYLEPTTLKKKVDEGAEKLGITPYEKLTKRDDDFIMLNNFK